MSRLLDRIMTEPVMAGFPPEPHMMDDAERADVPLVRVVADDVARMYWQSEQIEWDFRTDFGPLRPPFDYMWMEFRIPRRVYSDGGWHDVTKGEQITEGVVMMTQPAETSDVRERWLSSNEGLVVTLIHFAGWANGPVTRMPFGSAIHITEDGDFIDRIIRTPEAWGPEPSLDNPMGELFARSEAMTAHQAMLAVSMMNCRNISLEDVTPSEKVSARHKKKTGLPLTRFTRVLVPGAGTATKAEMQASLGSPQPWHLVRGHFKTYTEDAPLFGSHTGTWWWGWQARGSSRHGANLPTYEVG